MEVNKTKGIYTYYLLTTGFLHGGKSCSKIDMKKDRSMEHGAWRTYSTLWAIPINNLSCCYI